MVSQFDQQFLQSAAPMLAQHFGVQVRLLRAGATASDPFTCSFARTLNEVELDDDALGTAAERRTWYALRADLVLDGSLVVPRAGDVLAVVDADGNQTGEQHEVAPNGPDRAVEEHPDGAHWWLLTKKVKTTTTTTAAP